MKCPACSNQLQEMTVGDVTVDVCKGGCGGIWFDNFELKKFDEPHESAGEALLDVECDASLVVDRTKRLKCPKCDDVVMMRHFFSVKKEVEVDECPGCGGFWLDAGELRKIRSIFNTEEERHKAADEYFSEVFGADFAAMQAERPGRFRICSASFVRATTSPENRIGALFSLCYWPSHRTCCVEVAFLPALMPPGRIFSR